MTKPLPSQPAFARTWSATIRYPVLALTWLFLKPVLWVVNKAGWSEPLWLAVGRRMRETFIGGHDFGDYRPTGRDVVVCAYPKAGQNWTMQIAVQIATRGTGEFRHIHEVVPWPDWAKQDMVVPLRDARAWRAAPTGLRVIKTIWSGTACPTAWRRATSAYCATPRMRSYRAISSSATSSSGR